MIPTALTEAETIALSSTAKHVVSVDPHDGYPQDAPRPTLGAFLDNLANSGHADRVTVCIGRDDVVCPFLARRSFDLVFIDLTGEFAATQQSLRRAQALVADHGTIAVHDYGHPEWPGVANAVNQVLGDPPQLVDTLAVFTRPWQ